MPIDTNSFPVMTITQFVGGDFGEIWALAYLSDAEGGAVSSATRIIESSTSYTLQNDYIPTRTTIYEGTGFTFGPDGALTGTINSITFMDGTTVLAVISVESLDAQTFDSAVADLILDDFTAIDSVLKAHQFIYDASTATGAVSGEINVPGRVDFTGSDYDDYLYGGDGDDTFAGGLGADVIDGGAGTDTVDYSSSDAGVTVYLAGLVEGGHAEGDQLSSIENIIGSEYGDTLTGDAGDNVIDGYGGNDTLWGREGNDTLSGHGGNDILYGTDGDDYLFDGDGNDNLFGGNDNDYLSSTGDGDDNFDGGAGIDMISYANHANGVTIDLAASTVSGIGIGADTIVNFEDAQGSDYGGDTLYGDAGNNVLDGRFGTDVLDGRAGDDQLVGSGGNDILIGGDGWDVARYDYDDTNGGTQGIIASLLANVAIDTFGDIDTLSGIEEISGSVFGDVIIGDAGANTLSGFAGADTLAGGAGNDQLYGGAGADLVFGGIGDDILYGASTGVDGADTDILLGDEGNDTLYGGGGSDVLLGGDDNDTLFGGDDVDSLNGGAGADILVGGGGTDILFGGFGADVFLFATPSDGVDLIKDFASGEDGIALISANFGLTATGGSLAGTGMFQSGMGLPADFGAPGAPVVYYETSSNALLVDATGGDSSDAVLIAILETGTLTESDVFLF